MKYRKLGRTDIKVSEICLGSMTWGTQNNEQEAHEQLDYSLEQGVNFIDTAEMYSVPPTSESYSRTETIIGKWIAKRGKRDDVILATKVCGKAENLDYARPNNQYTDLSAEQIKYAIDGSLKRLQTDYIDLYQLHWPSRTVQIFGKRFFPLDAPTSVDGIAILETLGTLNELVEAGKIRHIGLSNESPWGLHEFLRLAEQHNLTRVVSVQNPYSLLNRTYEYGMAEFSLREEVGLLAYSPLASGLLSGKYMNGAEPEGARLVLFRDRFGKRYEGEAGESCVADHYELAKKHGLDSSQLAIAFTLFGNFVTSTIIGATTMEQLKINIGAAELKLSDEVIDEIQRLGDYYRSPAS